MIHFCCRFVLTVLSGSLNDQDSRNPFCEREIREQWLLLDWAKAALIDILATGNDQNLTCVLLKQTPPTVFIWMSWNTVWTLFRAVTWKVTKIFHFGFTVWAWQGCHFDCVTVNKDTLITQVNIRSVCTKLHMLVIHGQNLCILLIKIKIDGHMYHTQIYKKSLLTPWAKLNRKTALIAATCFLPDCSPPWRAPWCEGLFNAACSFYYYYY